jgi:hypothetical protein
MLSLFRLSQCSCCCCTCCCCCCCCCCRDSMIGSNPMPSRPACVAFYYCSPVTVCFPPEWRCPTEQVASCAKWTLQHTTEDSVATNCCST